MITQQILTLKIPAQKYFDTFWASAEQQFIISKLKQLQTGESCFLWGEPQHGLSHLAQACCHYWQEHNKHCLYLDLHDIQQYEAILPAALDGFDLVIFDHLEAALQNTTHEEMLFHCYNRLLQDNTAMLWVAHTPPEDLPCQLADLKSRFKATLILHLKSYSDQDKIHILKLYAKQYGILLNKSVAKYLISHYARDLKSLLKLIEELDKASLSAKKNLTIPFIKKYLSPSVQDNF